MKVITYSEEENDYGEGGYYGLKMENDNGETIGAISVWSMSDCPEDALLSRSLGFVYDIPRLLKEAYEAGKRGEGFEIRITSADD